MISAATLIAFDACFKPQRESSGILRFDDFLNSCVADVEADDGRDEAKEMISKIHLLSNKYNQLVDAVGGMWIFLFADTFNSSLIGN
ncbi:unnamed protein product, partial [Absidia cylindrospora]